MRFRIVNGRVVDPATGLDAVTNLYIEKDRIVGVGSPPAGFAASRTIGATGKWVIPGLVDLAARLREPGQEHKATIESETRAAASGGITSLTCPPDTKPVVDSPAEVELIQQRAADAGYCRVYSLGALTKGLEGRAPSEMAALKTAGCVGVSQALNPIASPLVLRRAMEYAASTGHKVFLHPLDFDLMDHGCAHEGAVATRMGLSGIPEAAETAALGQMLALIEQTGASVHFCRLSTTRAVRMVARARYDGLPITADVCAHQLFLTEMDVSDFNSLCHTIPPLRTRRDLEGLRTGLVDGSITAVCSDHQPHEPDAKRAPFAQTEPGVSGVETLLALMLRLVHENLLTLTEAISLVTHGPASITGIDGGTLSEGSLADIVIIDPDAAWELVPCRMQSRGKNSPFSGWEFTGRVTHTLLGGRIVYKPRPQA